MTIQAVAGGFTVCQVKDFGGVDWTIRTIWTVKTRLLKTVLRQPLPHWIPARNLPGHLPQWMMHT